MTSKARHNKDEKPTEQARCSCGVKTDWVWDDDPECYEEGDGEWLEKLCWRCAEIRRMKCESTSSKLGFSGRLNTEQADRFIEYMFSDVGLLPEDQIKEIKFVR
jgi:hypothetical protein